MSEKANSLIKTIFCLFVLIVPILPTSLYAQREQIGVRYETWGRSEGENAPLTSGTTTVGYTKVGLTAYSINLNGSIRTIIGEEGETIILNGFIYRFLDIEQEYLVPTTLPLGSGRIAAPTNQPPLKSQYHLLQYDFTVLHSLSDDWTAVVALRPGVFSDFVNITWDHFRFEAAGFADYIVSPSFTIGFGIAIQPSNFGRVLPAIPLLHILNNGNVFGKKYLLDVLLPQRADFTMYLSKPLEVGFSVALIGSSYFIGDVKNRIGFQSDRLAFANATLSGVVRYNLFDKLYITGDAGYTLLRRYEYSVSRFKELGVEERPESLSFDLPNAYFLRAGISILY